MAVPDRVVQPARDANRWSTRQLVVAILMGSSLIVNAVGRADEPSSAQASKSTPSDGEIMKIHEIEGISEYRLHNGVRVLLFPDPSKDVVTVNMTIFVGSRHEGYGEAGMAHLLEHMLFKGTPTHPDIPKLLKDRGAVMNGTTWMDRTNYYETLPATDDNLEFAIRLEADRLVNSKILGEDLASEMTVVRNEFEIGENSPFRVLMQRIQSAAYEWHNYGRTTIGNRSDIERVPVVKLREFYRKFYRPDNVMVIVAGKFEPEQALAHLNKYFGELTPPDKPIDDTYTTEPAQDGERTVVVRRVGEVQLVGSAYHIPSGSHPDYAAAKALVSILGDEPSGRLYRGMVETEIASSVYTLAYGFAEPGLLMALAEVPAAGSVEQARLKLIEVMETSFAEEPITDKEVERAVQQILKQRELEAADTDQIAISLSDWAAQGDWRLYFLFRDEIEKLSRDHVQQVAEKYFVRNNRTVGLFIPGEKSERIAIPEAPNLAQMLDGYQGREAVAAGEQIDPSPAAIEQRTERGKLIGGVTYALLPKKTRGETVSMELTLRFGTGQSLQGRVGAVELLGLLMSRGTDQLDYSQLEDERTRLRTDWSINSTVGLLQLTVKTKRQFLPELIGLLGDVLRRPRLDSVEFEVIRRQIITSLEQGTTEPQALAPRSVRKRLAPYAPDHVLYERSVQEEIALYQNVKVEELRQLHAEFLSNQAGEVAIVGDFDPQEVKAWLSAELAGWETSQPYERVERKPHPEIEGGLDVIETPDKANAFYYSSQQYELSDDDPAYAALVLGNYILGGGSLSSRLGNRVRQQEGLSYGVRSGVRARAKDKRVDFTLYAMTNPQNKDRLMAVIREELDRIRAEGVTEAELAEAKVAYLQSLRVQRTSDPDLTSELLGTLFNERTMEYHAEHERQIEAATVESVNEAIRTYIVPDKLVLAIAGDFAAAE
jgi:zinc protease